MKTSPRTTFLSRIRLRGLVLAGGRSRRMGTDKANLPHPDGRPQARRTFDLLHEAGCRSVSLSLHPGQARPDGFLDRETIPILHDEEPAGAGPMGGLLAALRDDPQALWMVAACDLPRLEAATLETLLSAWTPEDPALAFRGSRDGLPEPLCALYAPASRTWLESAWAEGCRCPRKVLIRNHCRLLSPLDDRSLDNANTPDDWLSCLTP